MMTVANATSQPRPAIAQLVARILETGQITRSEQHLLLSDLIPLLVCNLAEQQLIAQVLEVLQAGRLSVID
ncbi:hypothetical protein [Leptolyngbya sp. FACHB-261]|uniref:hypothetical protein n=1 Tax=Leptolyngbya sp. FACHB-261 TaxID=2692806 RepID=UPI001686F3A2|nr:hypothetical protein [Leptolyngbya sp. FACHB-261]MBD2102034.1 hypothetical protein [Leptolyngbya sp. FACHB-261]